MAVDRATTWRVGDLAAECGLTVRTLHHYDEIGLLRPSFRSAGGHRLYTVADATRLYEIVALRGLGLRLDQVRSVLTDGVDPRVLVAEQLRVLALRRRAAARLHDRLTEILAELDDRQHPTAADLLDLVRRSVAVESVAADHLSEEVLDRVTSRQTELGSATVAQLTAELTDLYRQALAEFDAETVSDDPVITAIVSQIDRVSASLSGHDDGVTSQTRELWADHGERVYPGEGVPWRGLVDYLETVRQTMRSGRRITPPTSETRER